MSKPLSPWSMQHEELSLKPHFACSNNISPSTNMSTTYRLTPNARPHYNVQAGSSQADATFVIAPHTPLFGPIYDLHNGSLLAVRETIWSDAFDAVGNGTTSACEATRSIMSSGFRRTNPHEYALSFPSVVSEPIPPPAIITCIPHVFEVMHKKRLQEIEFRWRAILGVPLIACLYRQLWGLSDPEDVIFKAKNRAGQPDVPLDLPVLLLWDKYAPYLWKLRLSKDVTRADLAHSLSRQLLVFMQEVLEKAPKPNESEWKFISKVKDISRIYIMSMVKYAATAGILGDPPYAWVVEFAYSEPCFDSAD